MLSLLGGEILAPERNSVSPEAVTLRKPADERVIVGACFEMVTFFDDPSTIALALVMTYVPCKLLARVAAAWAAGAANASKDKARPAERNERRAECCGIFMEPNGLDWE
jgi:hypothetical protein